MIDLIAVVAPVAPVPPAWTWRETLATLAIVFSAGALVVSWIAYRQRVRYHPQPKLMLEWSERIEPTSGLFFRRATIFNRGDAVARRVQVEVRPSETTPWHAVEEIEPGKSLTIRVPVVDGVKLTHGARGVSFDRVGAPENYRFVTPTVFVRWIQVPLDAKPRIAKWTAPKTPDLLAGDVS